MKEFFFNVIRVIKKHYETLRELLGFPERAFNKVVLPQPGGPSSKVILQEDKLSELEIYQQILYSYFLFNMKMK